MSVQREAFEEFAERAEEQLGDSLKKLLLFGSVARGEENEDSDVDVFAVVESGEDRDELHRIAFEVEVEYDTVISLIARTGDRFNKHSDTSFIREVMETGKVHV